VATFFQKSGPDAHFSLEVPGAGTVHHFLEIDRGNVSLERVADSRSGAERPTIPFPTFASSL
jgi:hypothetical protein